MTNINLNVERFNEESAFVISEEYTVEDFLDYEKRLLKIYRDENTDAEKRERVKGFLTKDMTAFLDCIA